MNVSKKKSRSVLLPGSSVLYFWALPLLLVFDNPLLSIHPLLLLFQFSVGYPVISFQYRKFYSRRDSIDISVCSKSHMENAKKFYKFRDQVWLMFFLCNKSLKIHVLFRKAALTAAYHIHDIPYRASVYVHYVHNSALYQFVPSAAVLLSPFLLPGEVKNGLMSNVVLFNMRQTTKKEEENNYKRTTTTKKQSPNIPEPMPSFSLNPLESASFSQVLIDFHTFLSFVKTTVWDLADTKNT